MNSSQTSRSKLVQMVVSRYLMAFAALAAMFFLPAGTFDYWQAWVYLAILFIPMLFVMIYMIQNSPDLLERRMRMKEREKEQSLIVKLSYIPFLVAFILPGFDHRFEWSNVPVGVVILIDLVVLLGYGLVFLVFRENQYASRVVEVEQNQTVIQSGPYAHIRHPMYAGLLPLYVLSPLALGSWWAVIPALPIVGVIVARIFSEEKILLRDLPGYREYMQKVRFRLIPGVW